MNNRDDWFDDFMAMKMMEEDETSNSNDVGDQAGNRGCLPGILIVLAILFIIFSLFD